MYTTKKVNKNSKKKQQQKTMFFNQSQLMYWCDFNCGMKKNFGLADFLCWSFASHCQPVPRGSRKVFCKRQHFLVARFLQTETPHFYILNIVF